jgi:signal transduction histidine kinase/streptogramin lyase
MKGKTVPITRWRVLLLIMSLFATASQWLVRAQSQGARYGVDIWRETEGLAQSRARDIAQTRDGYLWLATDGGVVRFNGASFTAFTAEPGNPRDYEAWDLQEDDDGGLWIGSYGGLTLLKQGRFTTFTKADGLPDNIVTMVDKDRAGNIWFATPQGIGRYAQGQFTRFTLPDGFATQEISALCADAAQGMFVATRAKLRRMANGSFQALAGNRVHAIHEDEEGALWFATREGLSRLKDGRFVNFTVEAGLLTSFLYSILDDGRGNFWFSRSQDVFRISKDELRAVAAGKLKIVTSYDYGIKGGMKTRAGNPGNQPTAWKTADGALLFCTLQGLVMADPAQRMANNTAPPAYIEEVFINKQRQDLGSEPAAPQEAGEIEIHFASLNYSAPEKMRYQYRLSGVDPDWIDAGTRRFAYYANLAPGRYRFQARAGNLDGPWNETGAAFAFYLQPRFYRTQLFYALAGLTVLLIVVGIYRLRMRGLKARYSAVLAERNRIAGEIHDTLAQNLAGIALQLDSVTMQLSDAPTGLRERLDQACNLTRYSLAEARRAVTDLRSDDLEQRELAAALPEIVNRLTAASGLQTRIEVAGARRRLNPMAEKNLLRIFQEGVANAVKHAHARNLHIELRYDNDHLTLRVQDDGCGFDTNQIVPLGVGHYGLTGMRERVERIGGHLHLRSRPGAGTELLIEAPFTT